jgi:hypothetical protein
MHFNFQICAMTTTVSLPQFQLTFTLAHHENSFWSMNQIEFDAKLCEYFFKIALIYQQNFILNFRYGFKTEEPNGESKKKSDPPATRTLHMEQVHLWASVNWVRPQALCHPPSVAHLPP